MTEKNARDRECDRCGAAMDPRDVLSLHAEIRLEFGCPSCGRITRINKHVKSGKEHSFAVIYEGRAREVTKRAAKKPARTVRRKGQARTSSPSGPDPTSRVPPDDASGGSEGVPAKDAGSEA